MQAVQQPPALPFERATRNKTVPLITLTKPANGGLTSLELPKTGYLARLWLNFSITITGTLTSPNALGVCSAIRRIRVTTNSGVDLVNISGAGFFYLLQNAGELGGVNGRQPQNQGNTAVAVGTYNLDAVLPFMLNLHDTVGAILLQNEQLQVTLTVEWEADTNVAAGATITGTCIPNLEFFTVPPDPRSRLPLNLVQQIIEDQMTIPNTADYTYNLPRGNTYMGIYMGYGIGSTPADNWTKIQMRINQSDYLYNWTPAFMTQYVGYQKNLVRGLGQIYYDFLGSDGLGAYGGSRDFINSALLTDFQTVITPSVGNQTLYVVRRMLLPLATNN